ncbi:hypothetical protein V8E53_012230 [Lactarius tabidus]
MFVFLWIGFAALRPWQVALPWRTWGKTRCFAFVRWDTPAREHHAQLACSWWANPAGGYVYGRKETYNHVVKMPRAYWIGIRGMETRNAFAAAWGRLEMGSCKAILVDLLLRLPAAGGRSRTASANGSTHWGDENHNTPLSRTSKALSTLTQSFTAHRSLNCRSGESQDATERLRR